MAAQAVALIRRPDDRPVRLTIGEVCRLTGMKPGTLRNWEERYGLLEPTRTAGGTRLYSQADVRRIEEIQGLLRANGNSLLAAARSLKGERRTGQRRAGDRRKGDRLRVPQTIAGLKQLFDLAGRAEVAIENARLLEVANRELSQAVEFEKQLHHLAAALVQEQDLDTVLEVAASTARAIFLCDGVAISLDRDGQSQVRAVAGTGLEELHGFAFRIGGEPSVAEASRGRVMVFNDVPNSALAGHPLQRRIKARTLLIAPLRFGDHRLGSLALFHTRAGEQFLPAAINRVEILAAKVAAATANAQTFKALHESQAEAHARELRANALYEISRSLTVGLEIEPMLEELCRGAATVFGAAGAVALLTEGDARLRPAILFGFSGEEAARIRSMHISATGENAGAVALRTGRVQIVHEAATDSRTNAGLIALYGWQSILVAPLISSGRTIGVLGVGHPEPHRFREGDDAIAEALASQVAAAIDRAQAFEALRLRQQVTELEAQIAQSAASSLDLDTVLQGICTQTAQAMGLDRVSIWLPNDAAEMELAAEAGLPTPPALQRTTALRVLAEQAPSGRAVSLSRLRGMRSESAREIAEPGVRDAILVPFGLAGRASGILTLAQVREARPLGTQDIEMAEAVARHAALAIGNALAYRGQQEAIQRLDELNGMKSSFLSTMRHELRTPLNAILGFSDLLHSHAAGELTLKQERYVNNIRQAGRNLLHLVDDILEYSVVQSRETLEREPVAIKPLLEEVAAGHLAEAESKNITLQVEAGSLTTITGDRLRLGRAVRQLIDNAIEFSPEGGRVTVTAEEAGGAILIVVRDTGAGIAPEDLQRIFEPFVQVDSSDSRPHNGSGLGLAISRRIVALHGGQITVESVPGKGSAFTVRLPHSTRTTVPEGGNQ